MIMKRQLIKKIPDEERTGKWELRTSRAADGIRNKQNWSVPGLGRITNFWWKHAYVVHEEIATIFLSISDSQKDPSRFTQGKATLIPKPGEFSSENQRTITQHYIEMVYHLFACSY